ncbi:metal ABC transporter permease [Paraferrimonas haliotis]|uniref:ABC transporter n=1 Tax=Paraferrimonas haliotis TaxID=2013866 RepID=A0AA37WY18_9GAMM|nr:metal ABC transporter permease [Paraferrimonas haliotis]GLS82416.1 ABC transporter [Paraferrimonas haliotis]
MVDWDLISILMPAFAAAIVVLSTHVLLGRQVLKRGIIFIDLAIAQVAALGSVLTHIWHPLEELPLVHLWVPLLFALAAAMGIAWLEKRARRELEAIIGCLYVVSAVAALLMLSHDPHGAELLKRLLDGQILWVNWHQLMIPGIITAVVLVVIMTKPQLMEGRAFYLIFALVITQSVELIGVYLVFSSLILPALAVNSELVKRPLVLAYSVGISAYLIGLACSAMWDLPAGAAIVATLAISAIVCRLTINRFSHTSQA